MLASNYQNISDDNTVNWQSQWKAGKRRAEKDELVGGALFRTIVHPGVTVEVDQA